MSGANWTTQRNVKKVSSIFFIIFIANAQVYINVL